MLHIQFYKIICNMHTDDDLAGKILQDGIDGGLRGDFGHVAAVATLIVFRGTHACHVPCGGTTPFNNFFLAPMPNFTLP